MALFSSVFGQLFEHFANFFRRRRTPPKAQKYAVQDLAAREKLPEAFDSTAENGKRRKRRRQYRKEEERRVKKEREMSKGGSYKDKAEKERETLSLEMTNVRGHVQSFENVMKGESKHREVCKKKRKKRKLKDRETTEPAPLLVEVKTQRTPPARSAYLNPIEVELPKLPSVSEHLAFPASRFKPLPPVAKQPMRPALEEVTLPGTPLLVHPPKPLPAPPCATQAPDELLSSRCSRVSPPKQLLLPRSATPGLDDIVALHRSSTEVCPPSLVKPQLSTSSMFELPPQLTLIDLEDEENDYMDYTEKTILACDLPKSKRPQLLKAEINSRMAAWVESNSEVLEEVLVSEVVEVQGLEEDTDDPNEIGNSKPIQEKLDEASQKKKMDEHMTKLFCVTSPEGYKNKSQHHVNVREEPKRKRKVSLFVLTWAEEKAKKKEEKKTRKKEEKKHKELLLERYRNDPKLKHLFVNKHNHHYHSFK